MSDGEDQRHDGSTDELLRAAPGLVRIAGEAWWRTAGWTVGATARASSRVLRAALSGQTPADLFATTGTDARSYVRRLLGIVDPSEDAPDEPTGPSPARA